MDQTKESLLTAIIYMARFLFVASLAFGIYLADKAPMLVRVLASIIFVGGPFVFFYGIQTMKKYKSISDYEPTQLLGRNCNGKQVRSFSQGLGIIGVLFSISGALLFFFSL